MNNFSKKILKNKVYNRFLPISQTVLKGLEREPKITDFTLIKELGCGSFGRVLLVQHKKTQAQYALKAIDKRIKDNIEEKDYFRREIEIMYRINHPNVVKLFGHFEENTFCYFIMEYIPKGNLYSFVPKRGIHKISDRAAVSIIKDTISALYYLHHMNPPILHRDIKPENILISDNMRAKLTDFGWSNYLRGNYKRKTICGTPIYLAPEIINNFGHDEKIDIWCVGVLMFELLTGQAPWEGDDVNTVKNNILRLNIKWPKNIDKDAKDLISKILKYMPEERPSLRTILSHKFFLKYFPDAVNCLKKPNSIGNKLYIISKDHPLAYNEMSTNIQNYTNYTQNYTEITPQPTLLPYKETKASIYNLTPIKTNNGLKSFLPQCSKINNYIISPSIRNNNIAQTNYNNTRSTYINNPEIKKILENLDFYFPKTNNNIKYHVRSNGEYLDPNSTRITTYSVTKNNNNKYNIKSNGEYLDPNSTRITTYSVSKNNNNKYNLKSYGEYLDQNSTRITTYSVTKTNNNKNHLSSNGENLDSYFTRINSYPVNKTDNNKFYVRTNGYSYIPRNTVKVREMIQNEERIRELVRKTKLMSGKNYSNGNDNNRPSYLYETRYKTLIPTNFSNKSYDFFGDNSFNNNLNSTLIKDIINKAFENEKYDFSITNNRQSTLNNINSGNTNSFKILNDPDILRWKEQEKLRRESERKKINSLLNKYGMDSKSNYSIYNYNFI